MKKSIEMIKTFCADEDGATAVEYGLMVALIAGVIVTAVELLGGKVNDAFTTVKDAFPPVAAP